MNKYLIILASIILLSSCLDLSPNLFNPSTVDEYEYDEYLNGEFNLPAEYDILDGELTELSITSTYDGVEETIFAAYLGDINTIDTDTVILYCHGNAANIDVYFQRAKMLYNANGKSSMGVLIYDYRGFGKSTGATTVESLKADTQAMVEWLKEQGLQEDRFFIYGFSLGSIAAVHACHTNLGLNPKKIMLEAPIGSIDAMAEDGSGLSIPGSFFADADVNNIEDIKLVSQDLYWLHGIDDDFLAMQTHGRPIFDNHSGDFKVDILVVKGNHGDTPFVMGIEDYIESIEDFVNN